MAQTDSKLNMEAVEEFFSDGVSASEGYRDSHVIKGDNAYSAVSTAHSTRFSSLDGKEVSLDE